MFTSNQLRWPPGNNEHRPPWLLRYRSSKWFIMLTVTAAVFTDIFLYAVIVPVIPFALQHRVNIAPSQVQTWVSILVAVYGGSLAACSPLCGWFADRTSSRQLPLILGLLALGGATVMLNLGSSIAVLVVGRLLQGLSAAVVWVVGLALVADSVGREEVGQTMAWVFMGMSMAMLFGPLLGGVVFAKAGYNWVFGMTYILIGVDIAMRLMIVEKKLARKWLEEQDRPLDQVKSADGAQGVGLELQCQEDREEIQQENNRDTIELADVAAEVAIDPLQPEANSSSQRVGKKLRLPPVITLLKSRRLLASLWGTIVLASLLTQFDSVLPLHVQHAFNWNSTGAGLVFLPLVIPSFIGPVVGWAVDRFGPRWLATAGFVAFAPFEMLLRLVTHDTLGQKILLFVLLAFIGLTLDLVLTPIMAEITFVVASKEKENPGLFGAKGAYAQAYGLFNLSWAAGCLIGPLWAGMVNQRAGWGTMTLTFGLLGAMTAIPTVIWCGGYAFVKRNRRRGNNTDNVHDA